MGLAAIGLWLASLLAPALPIAEAGRCPPGTVPRGKRCVRCPEGFRLRGGRCVRYTCRPGCVYIGRGKCRCPR